MEQKGDRFEALTREQVERHCSRLMAGEPFASHVWLATDAALRQEIERLKQERDARDVDAGLYCAKWEDAQAKLAQAEQDNAQLRALLVEEG